MLNADCTLVSTESVRQKLLASVNQTWQEELEQRLSQEHDQYQSLNDDHKFTLILDYILHTDIRHFWNAQGKENTPWLAQVEQVQDISQPVRRRCAKWSGKDDGSRNAKRMLKMVLFDGQKHYIGLEHESLGFSWPQLGSKIVIDEGILEKNGTLMLTPQTCGFLGGCVKEFEEHQNMIDMMVQEPLYGRRGPPLQLNEYMRTLHEKIQHHRSLLEESKDQTVSHRNHETMSVKDHIERVDVQHGDERIKMPHRVPHAVEMYVIPSDSDDDWDVDAVLEKKRSRVETPRVDDSDAQQGDVTPVVELDANASTLRELKRRKELRARHTPE